jgi:hypothetical protein
MPSRRDLPADFEILPISAVWGFQIPKVLLTFPQPVRFVKTYGKLGISAIYDFFCPTSRKWAPSSFISLAEIHDRIGYSYKIKGTDSKVKRRRYKPHELLQVVNVTNVINNDRVKRDEKSTNKHKSICQQTERKEDMAREHEQRRAKAMKQV